MVQDREGKEECHMEVAVVTRQCNGREGAYEGGVTVTTGGRENYTHTVGRRALCPLLDMEGDCPQLFHHHMKIL